jgi:hypothetical protein
MNEKSRITKEIPYSEERKKRRASLPMKEVVGHQKSKKKSYALEKSSIKASPTHTPSGGREELKTTLQSKTKCPRIRLHYHLM